ncbi:MAG: response regulator [Hahellaceae bacterium]|nr:response regulator [Hahellaceae bacterium]
MDKLNILLVEDNPDDQLLAIRAFEQVDKKNKVVVVEDGEQALDYLYGQEATGAQTDRASRLGIILLDIKLPKLNGLEVLKAVRQHPETQWMPVIMFTSSDEPAEMLEAYRLGANSYIKKPLDYKQFVNQMDVLAKYWLKLNKVPGECLNS